MAGIMSKKPIVWSIAGSDSGGGAGIQADLYTFHDLGVFGCTAITAITAQNSHSVQHIHWCDAKTLRSQLRALDEDLPAKVIKLGMLGSLAALQVVAEFLKHYNGLIVCDPVLVTSSGTCLNKNPKTIPYFIEHVLPQIDLLTPNQYEVQALLQERQEKPYAVTKAGQALLDLGAKNVLIKGGPANANMPHIQTSFKTREHLSPDYCQDYWCSAHHSKWLTLPRYPNENNHGSGCSLSAAVAACLAHDYSMLDAITLAKAYVTQGIRTAIRYGKGPGPVVHRGFPEQLIDLPWITDTASRGVASRIHFKHMPSHYRGIYPIVRTRTEIETLLPLGIKLIQLRIKQGKITQAMRNEIKTSIALVRRHQACLVINDHWQLALEYKADAVHLGQEDLEKADLHALEQAGIYLGISCHSLAEIAQAHTIRPSYLAFGPIFDTRSKVMKDAPQGLARLETIRRWVGNYDQPIHYPLVAIGGIDASCISKVLGTGIRTCAVLSSIAV